MTSKSEMGGGKTHSKMVHDMGVISNPCRDANEGACNEVTFLQGKMSMGCPRVCKQYWA